METNTEDTKNPPAKCRHTGFYVVIFLITSVLLVSLILNAGMLVSLVGQGAKPSQKGKGVDEYPKFSETVSYGHGDVKAVRILVEGVIMRDQESGLFAPPIDRIELLLQQIKAAENDEKVRAIILEVDSPGGAVTASDEIYSALMRFRESREDRRVIAYMRGLAASGGYYVSMAANYIIAQPTTVTGSIGVIMQALNFKGLSEKVGIDAVTIKSGANKDLLNPFREVQPEHVAIIQQLIDNMQQRFVDLVQEGRQFNPEEAAALADGRVFTADEALAVKLVDGIGYWDEVVKKVSELCGEESVKIIRYERTYGLLEALTMSRNPLALPRISESATPRFMYLWRP